MTHDAQTVLTIHGLDGDNKLVRADVFSRKLQAFLKGLAEADKLANGKRVHRFMIEDMKKGSAQIRVRERQTVRGAPRPSGVETYERALKAVYNADRSTERLPAALVTAIRSLTIGAETDFAHGEVAFDAPDNVVRIDDFLRKQSERASDLVAAVSAGAVQIGHFGKHARWRPGEQPGQGENRLGRLVGGGAAEMSVIH